MKSFKASETIPDFYPGDESARKRLIKILTDFCGYDVTTPYGATKLQCDIKSATGEQLSVNTIKRITGVLEYNGRLRTSTLDIISRYLGYKSFKELKAYIDGNSSEFGLPSSSIDLAMLQNGAHVEIKWFPDREIRLCHLSGGRYRVEEALNSKLKEGDILTLGIAGAGMPLIVSEVERDGRGIGPYTAAPESGVTSVTIL